jgi:hypothetical protein
MADELPPNQTKHWRDSITFGQSTVFTIAMLAVSSLLRQVTAPRWVWGLVAAAFMVVGVFWRSIESRSVLRWLVTVAILTSGLTVVFYPWPAQGTGPLPEVSLHFVEPKLPLLIIGNPSTTVAKEIKWMVVLWNLALPDRPDPLPIPVQTFDFINPGSIGGPQQLFGLPAVADLVKPGNELIGAASVTCAGCRRGRSYFVNIIFGQSGWFYELLNQTTDGPPIVSNIRDREAYFNMIRATPEKDRVAILPRQ